MTTKILIESLKITRARLTQLRVKYLVNSVDFTYDSETKRYQYRKSALTKLKAAKKFYLKNTLKIYC
jgi:predicted MPP superfamily phosphohydrolase